MNTDSTTRRRREIFVVVAVSLIVGFGVFFYLLLIGGGLFLAMLATTGLMALILCVHFLLWGRQLKRADAARFGGRSGPRRDGFPPYRFGPGGARRENDTGTVP